MGFLEVIWAQVRLSQGAMQSKHERLDAAGRRRMQNFTMLPRYLPAGLWDVLRASQAPNAGSLASTQALEALVDFSMRLGLQNPSEPTFATFFLLMNAFAGFGDCEEMKLTAAFLTCKASAKAAMIRLEGRVVDVDFQDLPADPVTAMTAEQHAKVYGGNALPERFRVDLGELERMRSLFRLRKPKAPTGDVTNLLASLGAVLQGGFSGLSKAARKNSEDLLPNLQIFPADTVSSSKSSAALPLPPLLPAADMGVTPGPRDMPGLQFASAFAAAAPAVPEAAGAAGLTTPVPLIQDGSQESAVEPAARPQLTETTQSPGQEHASAAAAGLELLESMRKMSHAMDQRKEDQKEDAAVATLTAAVLTDCVVDAAYAPAEARGSHEATDRRERWCLQEASRCGRRGRR